MLAGPYLRTRNPLYTGIVIALAGAAMGVGSWLLTLAVVAAALGAHVWVVQVEEPRLRARFGSAYAIYLRRVPRWLPGSRRAT